jgi:lipoprotein Spr
MSLKRFLPLLIVGLLLASCHGNKGITKAGDPPKKEESASKAAAKKIQEKYSVMLGIEPSKIDNIKLYSFVDDWYGVPYVYGGKTKNGVDCSGFACALYREVYERNLQGSSASLFEGSKPMKKDDLEEGDLVFFKINGDKISHVGVYLQNNKFVHASTKKGIMISDLNEEYYKKYFYKGGRPK